MLGQRFKIGPRGVEHRNAPLAGGDDIDIVGADPVLADHLQISRRIQHRRGDLPLAHDDPVGIERLELPGKILRSVFGIAYLKRATILF